MLSAWQPTASTELTAGKEKRAKGLFIGNKAVIIAESLENLNF